MVLMRFALSSRLFLALRVSYSISSRTGPRVPSTPASSKVSRSALSSMVSSDSHPPLGRIHASFRDEEQNRIRPSLMMGTHPVVRRTSCPVCGSVAHRCASRPVRETVRSTTGVGAGAGADLPPGSEAADEEDDDDDDPDVATADG